MPAKRAARDQSGDPDLVVSAIVSALTPIIDMATIRGDLKGIVAAVQDTRELVVQQSGYISSLQDAIERHDGAIEKLPCPVHAGKITKLEGAVSKLGGKIDELLGARARVAGVITNLILAVVQAILIWRIMQLVQVINGD